MSTRATASFEITAWEQTNYDEPAEGPKFSRATVRKTFRGDIEGESTAELLLCQVNDESAGYVAMERIVGRIGERVGSFVIQHCATRGGARPQALWLVLPGSGAGELRELRGEAEYRHDEHGATFVLDYDFE